ncbi:MAG TPA: extracellular solute-binding protein [Anaerolineales bacterium]|nr:extracellular solute-binding protein [Anaerolineales bacterium]
MKSRHGLRILSALLILATTTTQSSRLAAGSWAGYSEPAPNFREVGAGVRLEITADAYGHPLAGGETAERYDKPSVALTAGASVRFTVSVPTAGSYELAFDAAAVDALFNRPEGQLRVDGEFPSHAARRVIFPVFYVDQVEAFPLDRYGNEALPQQTQLIRWSTVALRDPGFRQATPSTLDLSAGDHVFELTLTEGLLYLGSAYLTSAVRAPAYADYLAAQPGSTPAGHLFEIEAEHVTFKDATSIRPTSSRSVEVTPYDTNRLLLNTLGGDTWKHSGSTAYYAFEVPADGYYAVTLRALQNVKSNFTVFRRITVNGEVPFAELYAVPFNYSTRWSNMTLGGAAPYQIYLHRGQNIIGIEATYSPYADAADRVQQALLDINDLTLDIRKLTGNQIDPFKEWEISEYIPDLKERLTAIADQLRADKDAVLVVNQGQISQEVLTYQMVIDSLDFLAAEPDKVPNRMNRLSGGSASAAQLLGKILPELQNQPLALDKVFIHSLDTQPPVVEVPFYMALSEDLKRFAYSFRPNPYQTIGAADGELEVWVNRPRQYVDLLQLMADQSFTPQTGIPVKFSLMPDEAKLVLANAAGIQPDVALGVSTHIPYELAVRNALKDLRSFEDFDSFIRVYTPGSLLSYIIDDSVYAIPETQDFWVTYYRRDILQSLDIPVPDTWEEVIEILPELQRYGMNYNTPLSGGSGYKNYLFTAPYLFNQGAELYSPDGFATGLESDEAIAGIRFMAESFTLYGMPLTTSSFYDSFRYGSLPIGVSNIETYVKLITAAPEIEGLWSIDLYPATVGADGQLRRYATGSAQASVMFAATDQPEESWKFLKWWMSTETQVDFQQQLVLNYGLEYFWNSANLDAFALAAIPQEHRDVILEQWTWLQEPVKLPGSYMQERELSNAWNRIVFDGVNPRVAIDSSVIIINREITRKMEEFGYLEEGEVVRSFTIPTIETVRGWMEGE